MQQYLLSLEGIESGLIFGFSAFFVNCLLVFVLVDEARDDCMSADGLL